MVKMRRCLSRNVSARRTQVIAHLRALALSGGGAFLREHGQRRVNDAAQRRLGDAGEVLGEDAAIVEVGGVLVPADAHDPVTGGFRGDGGDNLRRGNYKPRMQVRIERPDAIWTDKE